MDALQTTLRNAVFSYATGGINLRLFRLEFPAEKTYAINVIDTPKRFSPAGVVVLARIEGDTVVIEEDLTDRPLVDKLVEMGVPREKIILAYVGEAISVIPAP